MFNFSLFYFLLVLLFLICSSYTDIKKRIVSNKLVLLFLVIGIISKIIECIFLHSFNIFLISIYSFLICFIVLYILWNLGVFSAGDVKVFLVVSIFIPSNLVFLNIFDKIYILSKPIFSLNLLFFSIFATLPFLLIFAIFKLFNKENLILINKSIFTISFLISMINSILILFLVSSFLNIFNSILNNYVLFALSFILIILFNNLKKIISKKIYVFYGLLFGFLFIYNFYTATNIFIFKDLISIILGVIIIFILFVLYTIIKERIFVYTKTINQLKKGDVLYFNYYKKNNKVYTKKYNFLKYILDLSRNKYYNYLKIDSRKSSGILQTDIMFLKDSYNHNLIEKRIKLKKTIPFVPSILIAYIILNIIGDVFWFII